MILIEAFFALLASLAGLWFWLWSPLRDSLKFKRQSHIIKTAKLNEGDVYRSMDVKDGPLLAEPFPGVKTLHDTFM